MKKLICKWISKRIRNVGYDIINMLVDEIKDMPLEHYDDQEYLAETIEEMIIKKFK